MSGSSAPIGVASLLLFAYALAADPIGPDIQLSVTDPRPVAKAMEVLSDRHGVAITYEDPSYEFAGDLVDVASKVSRSPSRPGQKLLIPRGGPIELTYTVSSSAGKVERVDAVIRRVLDTYAASGAGSQFEVTEDGNVFHVVPVMTKSSRGALQAMTPVLDTPITVPIQTRSGFEMIDAICKALTATSKSQVVVGTVPMAALANEQVTEGGANEPARDMLSRVLQQITGAMAKKFGPSAERPFVWQLFFDPMSRSYALNLRLLKSEVREPQPTEDIPPDPNALDPRTGRPQHQR